MAVARRVAGQLGDPSGVFGDVSPLAVVGLVVALVLLGLGVVLYRRWRARAAPGRRLERLLTETSAVTILLHPNPDPDAMATALGVQAIAKRAGVPTDVVHPGGLRHHENRAFRTVLDLDLRSIDRRDELDDREVVLVDHGVPRGFDGAAEVQPVAVIDHHDDDPVSAEFVDVRPDYGACSSIVVEYFRDLGLRVVEDGAPPIDADVATALAYGIHTDTNRLTRGATHREFEALRYLFPGVDHEKLERVANPSIESDVLEAKAKAIINREVRDCYCISDIGRVPTADTVPIAAEELMRLEGVTSTIALGEFDGTIYLSGRTTDDRVHMGQTLERTLAELPGASGGGHSRMGGGQLPIAAIEAESAGSGLTRPDLHESLFWNLRDAG
ncbi:MAG: DHH family phosphoesterase [Halobacteriales archaeon]